MDLVKKMSVQDLYKQLEREKQQHQNTIEITKQNGIKLVEFHIKAADKDAAGSNQVGMLDEGQVGPGSWEKREEIIK